MNTEDVLKERKATHGEYSCHARCTQAMMRALQREEGWEQLPDIIKETLHMISHKMARAVTGNPYLADHWIDIQGYSKLIEQRIEDKVGLREGHRPVDLPGGQRPSELLFKADHNFYITGSETATTDKSETEELVQRALTQDDVTRHVQLRDGRRAAVVSWEGAKEPYAFRLREVLLVTEPKREEQELPMVNMFGESEAGRWHPTDVYGVWMPKEQRLCCDESGRANIGHKGELSSRHLCKEDVGKYAFRRDGQIVNISATDGLNVLIVREDGDRYWVDRAGFLRDPGLPNDADIRQVLK